MNEGRGLEKIVVVYIWDNLSKKTMTDAYSEHCQTFKIELFAKIVSGCKLLLQKSSILDI